MTRKPRRRLYTVLFSVGSGMRLSQEQASCPGQAARLALRFILFDPDAILDGKPSRLTELERDGLLAMRVQRCRHTPGVSTITSVKPRDSAITYGYVVATRKDPCPFPGADLFARQ